MLWCFLRVAIERSWNSFNFVRKNAWQLNYCMSDMLRLTEPFSDLEIPLPGFHISLRILLWRNSKPCPCRWFTRLLLNISMNGSRALNRMKVPLNRYLPASPTGLFTWVCHTNICAFLLLLVTIKLKSFSYAPCLIVIKSNFGFFIRQQMIIRINQRFHRTNIPPLLI